MAAAVFRAESELIAACCGVSMGFDGRLTAEGTLLLFPLLLSAFVDVLIQVDITGLSIDTRLPFREPPAPQTWVPMCTCK